MPVRFRPAEGGVRIEGVVVDCDADGRATSIEALRVPVASCSGQSRDCPSDATVRPDEHGEQRHEHKVAREHEPGRQRLEVEHELPVAEREPELGQHERAREQRRLRPARAGRGRAGRAGRARSGTAATAPCRTRRTRRPRPPRARRAARGRRGPRANQTQTADQRQRAWTTVWSAASASAPAPTRFCEPWLDAASAPSPRRWCAASRSAAPRLSICSGRLACSREAVPDPARRERRGTGRKRASALPPKTPSADERLAPPAPPPRRTASASGRSTAG